jgi:hypothetical protein
MTEAMDPPTFFFFFFFFFFFNSLYTVIVILESFQVLNILFLGRSSNQNGMPGIMVFIKSGSLFVEASMSCESWVYG